MVSRTTVVEIRVNGDFPPKKDGANSMWLKPTEVRRLRLLRSAAAQAFNGGPPLRHSIELELEVHLGRRNSRRIGDLDNFITGVCDGLMAANPRALANDVWAADMGTPICPSKCLAIEDDSEVVSISAKKIVGDTDAPWYVVRLTGL